MTNPENPVEIAFRELKEKPVKTKAGRISKRRLNAIQTVEAVLTSNTLAEAGRKLNPNSPYPSQIATNRLNRGKGTQEILQEINIQDLATRAKRKLSQIVDNVPQAKPSAPQLDALKVSLRLAGELTERVEQTVRSESADLDKVSTDELMKRLADRLRLSASGVDVEPSGYGSPAPAPDGRASDHPDTR